MGTLGAGDWASHISGVFAELLAEASEGQPETLPKSVEFMQYTVKAKTGHVLSPAALQEVRFGAMYALRDSEAAIRWATSFLQDLQAGIGAGRRELAGRLLGVVKINSTALHDCGAA